MANTTAALMAIPAPLESIRLVGDEEKHATLLFFGETSTLPDTAKQTLIDAVEMASTMLFPFGEAVVDVARLGNEVPPALVAMLSGENLNQIRNLFLMNPAIGDFRNNAQQHDGFTPHVTLSHPDFVEEAIQRTLMKQIYRVRFDRLSIWWNDERLDFDLAPQQDNLAMSDAIKNVLAHAVKLGPKKGKPGHILFISRGDKPKVGDQFSHQGTPHQVISVHTAPNDPKRHMVTAKKVAAAAAHTEWESYPIEDDEDDAYFAHHGVKGMKWGVRRSVDPATGRVEMTGRTGLSKTISGVKSTGDARLVVNPAGKTKAVGGSFAQRNALNRALKKGVVKPDLTAQDLAPPGLNPRTGSADKIAQDRIQKKIDTNGVASVSTAELQSYTRRLQMEKDVKRALAEQSAAQRAASDSFIKKFVKQQSGRQVDRVINKALDIAMEKALHELGIKVGKKGGNPDLADLLVKTSKRLQPKKGG